ncbi:MAG TPA: ABC transporter permease subunit [Myxococcota bacterium]|nr:ABC transporter permease subunit [Myxococcota bacterium]HND31924.1 ABC transporter permease subunit [Myxococcota bacterium]HNH45451.1 ABC transporter permease subunit [Myxococcota bacterium]
MNGAIAILKRETSAYFTTAIGWMLLLMFIFIFGFFFALSVTAFMDYSQQAAFNPMAAEGLNVNAFVVQGVFGNMAVVMLLVSPGMVMRLLAEDRKQKSMELLLTSPISSWEIVLGKFLGSMAFVVAMLLATLPYVAMLYTWGEPDSGVLMANYIALLCLSALLISVNLFLSSFTENQVVAFVIGFGFNLIFWVVGWAGDMAPAGVIQSVLQTAAFGSHYTEMIKGLIRIQDIVYFLTFIGFSLLATTQRVEALRWR